MVLVSAKIILGVPSWAIIVQLVKSISTPVLLYNSSHSSLAETVVPIQASSLITTAKLLADKDIDGNKKIPAKITGTIKNFLKDIVLLFKKLMINYSFPRHHQ